MSACGVSVGYQGGRNAIIVFWRPPSNLLLEDSMPVGHVCALTGRTADVARDPHPF